MRIVKGLYKMYINHMRRVCDNCTMEDIRNMAILGILLLIAGIVDAVRAS
jgi:hypothetical protein